ncbi:hypothetical protein E4U42_007736 [Claviceps africana]|uniref:Uncharacterized protein n=1 Tax=Claviceps africana TaxID=83212 RepID=A0A8K0NEG9_9HYPO|nr:hypothetical protein E4U42_007736 [Claviceps africana]
MQAWMDTRPKSTRRQTEAPESVWTLLRRWPDLVWEAEAAERRFSCFHVCGEKCKSHASSHALWECRLHSVPAPCPARTSSPTITSHLAMPQIQNPKHPSSSPPRTGSMNPGPPPGSHQPMLLPPRTPSELIADMLSHAPGALIPTTLVIGWPKEHFLAALTQDVRQQQPQPQPQPQHPLLRNPSLAQVAAARHMTMVFAPTVCHLRACLATWTPAQPVARERHRRADGVAIVSAPLLVVYGLLDLHRHDGTEWSAQGVGVSAAVLVESAWRSGFRAVMLEPRRRARRREGEGESEDEDETDETDETDELLSERLPVLSGTLAGGDEDASWTGPTVRVAHVLGDWFAVGRGHAL